MNFRTVCDVFKRSILFLPPIGALLVIIAYHLTPNYLDIAVSYWYSAVIGALAIVYVAALIYSVKNQKLRTFLRNKAPLYFAVMIIFIIWDGLTLKSGRLPMPYFPWPDRIINALINDRYILGQSVLHSARLLGLGYLLGAFTGLVTGILMGWYKYCAYWIMPLMRTIGPIPAISWIPVVMILFPTSFSGSVFLIALAVWFPVALLTYSGIINVRNAYFEVARTLGADERYLVFRIAIPASLPHIFLGLFQGIGVSCVTLIVAEMMGVKAGLGWYITWATGWAEYDKMYASLFLILLTFTAVIKILFYVRDKFLSWQKGVIKW